MARKKQTNTKKKFIDVRTIDGLQDLLQDAAIDLNRIKERDLQHVRVGVSTVNSGNSLLRTKLELEKWGAKINSTIEE